VRVGDVEYDVTNFKHPGGSVIFYMLANTGADATEAFTEFHMRSKKAWKMLKALPQRPAATPRTADPDFAMLADFAKWRGELEREGFFKPSRLHLAYRLLELALTFALGTYLMSAGHPVLASAVYGCFFGARCGWVQHEGGHNSLAGNVWWDKRIQAATCGTRCTTSTTRRRRRCGTTWTWTPPPRWRFSKPPSRITARADSTASGRVRRRGRSCR
jgi:hypothetical protein